MTSCTYSSVGALTPWAEARSLGAWGGEGSWGVLATHSRSCAVCPPWGGGLPGGLSLDGGMEH